MSHRRASDEIIGRGATRSRCETSQLDVYTADELREMDPTVPQTGRPKRDERDPVTRPQHLTTKEGAGGTPVDLTANYFRFDVNDATIVFYQYRVDFAPEVDDTRQRRRLVGMAFSVAPYNEVGYIYDTASMMFTSHRFDGTVTLATEEHQVILRQVGAGDPIPVSEERKMQVYNILLRRVMNKLDLQQVGRNLYDAKNRVRIPDLRLELWPGYINSIRQHQEHVLLNVELGHKVMRQETVYDVLLGSQRNAQGGDFQRTFKEQIIGKIVLTSYNNKTYKIDDVDFSKNPQETFDMKGVQTSMIQYYQTRYQLQIREVRQPLLVVTPSAADSRAGRTTLVYLVPELCRMTGLPESVRKNFLDLQKFNRATQLGPQQKAERTLNFPQRIANTPECQAMLSRYSLKMGKQLYKVKGRRLKNQDILFADNKAVPANDEGDWTMAFRNVKLFHTIKMGRWVAVIPSNLKGEAENFIRIMITVARNMGFDMDEPKKVEIQVPRIENYMQVIEQWVPKNPQLFLLVFPDQAKDRYDAVKIRTFVNHAVPSQVITRRILTNKKGDSGLMSIATKVAIQMSTKIGGCPWMVQLPLKGLMTIGFDVSHGTKSDKKSYGGFVATMDLNAEQKKYYSAVIEHDKGQEVSTSLTRHVEHALLMFKENHGAFPEKIFFYRDGVGDGQIASCLNHEVNPIKNLLMTMGLAETKFTFIVVNKRINTRFFLMKGASYNNPQTGTVVDSGVTLPHRYDFYLVSQHTRQGCVSPTSYNVIHDDKGGLDASKIQMLSYKLCHLYYNWSGTLSVPSVVQFAHKLSQMAGENLKRETHQDLSQRGLLYFL